MIDKNFYLFRTEMRKKLGRIYFYPEDIDKYISDIIVLVKNNEKYFKEFVNSNTKNEKEMINKIINYLKDINSNIDVAKKFEEYDKTRH